MALFKSQKPRSYHHPYIYVDERKEKLRKIEENAKRELGLLPPRPMTREEFRGTFVNATHHLKRRKESGRKPVSNKVLIIAIVLLLLVMKYLYTGTMF